MPAWIWMRWAVQAPFVSVLINESEVNPIGLEMVPANLIRPRCGRSPHASMPIRHDLPILVAVRDDEQHCGRMATVIFAPVRTFAPCVMP